MHTLSIKGHHLDITPALHEYVQTKLARVLKHFDQVLRVSVVMSVKKPEHHVEITLHMPHKDVHAEANAGNMYAALDDVLHKIDRLVLKQKESVKAHNHSPFKHFSDLPQAA